MTASIPRWYGFSTDSDTFFCARVIEFAIFRDHASYVAAGEKNAITSKKYYNPSWIQFRSPSCTSSHRFAKHLSKSRPRTHNLKHMRSFVEELKKFHAEFNVIGRKFDIMICEHRARGERIDHTLENFDRLLSNYEIDHPKKSKSTRSSELEDLISLHNLRPGMEAKVVVPKHMSMSFMLISATISHFSPKYVVFKLDNTGRPRYVQKYAHITPERFAERVAMMSE
jgi:hypothetical protein